MSTEVLEKSKTDQIYDVFRRWGYLKARLDDFGRLQPEAHAELDALPDNEEAKQARKFYCGSIGVEFMHIPDPQRRQWIQERMEQHWEAPDPKRILEQLIRVEVFEEVLQTRYLGNKRFSIEGVAALIPLLSEILEEAAEYDLQKAILGMSHRGRLNVIIRIVGRPAAEVFAGFEEVDPRSTLGGGDVKYHLGATGIFPTRNGKDIPVHLVSNPSHLEAVDPVALGRARATLTRLGKGKEESVLPVILHGDAAFAGQGILAETLNLANLAGFSVGGSIHVIVNNMIGFTALPEELHSSRFASDVAKRLPAPIFHVNAEDPEAVVRLAAIAADYRYRFGSDVFIDLIGYRRHGHSEIDDPTITQPLLYRKIKDHPPLWEGYARKLGIETKRLQDRVEEVRQEFQEAYHTARSMEKKPVMRVLPSYWDPYAGGRYDPELEVDTGVEKSELQDLSRRLTSWPEEFHVHEKVAKLLQQRGEMGKGERPVDYGMAEALAFASLLVKGIPVRLSGQDSKRATFNHRHSALIDIETEEEYFPLAHLSPEQAWFECYDSMLSEAAVLGFEYGFSRDYPDALVIWEAQFGDFVNGAQIIIDQFITAGEDKWDLLSGLVMLLPHGYEGQGPEHSSARVERFLQLAAKDNIQVCQPSTAAQYFHLLRRQALRRWRKPLIVLTPKSMLRYQGASSALEELSRPRFLPVLEDEQISNAERMLICTGKIGHELKREREKRGDLSTAIIFLDQLYPFPEKELREVISRHPESREILWVQEEPANMGALSFVFPRLQRLAGERRVHSVKRYESGTPATGSAKAHALEQQTLLTLAFSRTEKQ